LEQRTIETACGAVIDVLNRSLMAAGFQIPIYV
jgi:hypothetical protein